MLKFILIIESNGGTVAWLEKEGAPVEGIL